MQTIEEFRDELNKAIEDGFGGSELCIGRWHKDNTGTLRVARDNTHRHDFLYLTSNIDGGIFFITGTNRVAV